jgi:hypothetical protein
MTKQNAIYNSQINDLIPAIIGVEWNEDSSSPTLTRINNTGDPISSGYFSWENYFNAYPIHGNMWRCTLNAAGSPTYGTDAKGTGLTLTNDYTMVRIPKTYVKFEYEDPYWRWWISPTPATGFSIHPAFYQRDNHAAATNQIYVGAYTAGANGGTTAANAATNCLKSTNWTGLKLTSKSGVKNLTGDGSSSGTMAQFETAATAIGTGWGLTNFHTLNLMQLLFYIEYASFNSQTKVGVGRTNASNSSAAITGTYLDQTGEGAGTDIQSLLASNGTYGSTDDNYSVVWRGIENLWGNIYQFIPGYNTTDTEHRILNRDGTGTIADVLTAGNYEAVTSPRPLDGDNHISGTDEGHYCHGYVSALARDTSNILGLMFVPDALVGDSSTYLTDYCYSHQSEISQTGVLRSGGHWTVAGTAGIGYRHSGSGSSYSNLVIGGRIEFIG